MAIVNAFFDESGKMHDHPVVTFTGVCATLSRLDDFDKEWGVLLRRYKLKSLHMKEVSRLDQNHGPEILSGQSVDERINALLPFADCINGNLEFGLIQALDVSGFNSLTDKEKAGLGSPKDAYHFAFTRGILEVVNYVQPDDFISLVCDDDEATAWDCYRHYRGVRKVDGGVRKKIISLSFANDEHFPGLQAADMVAYLSRLEARKLFYGDNFLFQRLYNHLVHKSPPNSMQWFSSFQDVATFSRLAKSLDHLTIEKSDTEVL